MIVNEYLKNIIRKYQCNYGHSKKVADEIYQFIVTWANNYLSEVIYSGSYSKGTAVSNGTDVDLFISLSSSTDIKLRMIFESLYEFFHSRNFSCRKQNVSIGLSYDDINLDLVPGKRQSQYGYDHSLYLNKRDSWMKTNIKTHISLIQNSNRIDEIKLTKIWRNLNLLEFPSIYLELVVIEALKNKKIGDIANNFWLVLQYLSDSFENTIIIDPANTNNTISDDLTKTEKATIKQKSSEELNKTSWEEIIW